MICPVCGKSGEPKGACARCASVKGSALPVDFLGWLAGCIDTVVRKVVADCMREHLHDPYYKHSTGAQRR